MQPQFNKHKRQIAISNLKARRVELKSLLDEYARKYVNHAMRFGKDPNRVPRTAYSAIIEERLDKIDKELADMAEQDRLRAEGLKVKRKE